MKEKYQNKGYVDKALYGNSSETRKLLDASMRKLDQLEDNSNRWFAEDMLVDIANGNGTAVNMHLPTDFNTLTNKLIETVNKPEIKIAAIICPDWGGQEDGYGKWIYDMATLRGGLPQTAKSVFTYAQVLSQRAQMHDRPVMLHAQIPHWEITRSNLEEKTGLTTKEAEGYLQSSIQTVQNHLQSLSNSKFGIEVKLQRMKGFHDKVDSNSRELLNSNSRLLNSMVEIRRNLHGPNYTKRDAAVEITESILGWGLLKEQTKPDIILVPTSPTIARACLSGREHAWIQLKHNYQG
jgi:hypothetical protein